METNGAPLLLVLTIIFVVFELRHSSFFIVAYFKITV